MNRKSNASSGMGGIARLFLGLSGLHLALTGFAASFYLPLREYHNPRFVLVETQGLWGLIEAGGIDFLDIICLSLSWLLSILAFPFGGNFLRGDNYALALAQSVMRTKVINSLMVGLLLLIILIILKLIYPQLRSKRAQPGRFGQIAGRVAVVLGGRVNLLTRLIVWAFAHYLATNAVFLYEAGGAFWGASPKMLRIAMAFFQFPLTPFVIPRYLWLNGTGYELALLALGNSLICASLILIFFEVLGSVKLNPPGSFKRYAAASFMLLFLAALGAGQIYGQIFSSSDELYTYSIFNVFSENNKFKNHHYTGAFRGRVSVLHPYRVFRRMPIYKNLMVKKATYKPKAKALAEQRAKINPDATPNVWGKCILQKRRLDKMSDAEAQDLISRAVAVLRADDITLAEEYVASLSEELRNPKNEYALKQAKFHQDAIKYGEIKSVESQFAEHNIEVRADSMQGCAISMLAHFGHYAVDAAPYVIDHLGGVLMASSAGETLKAMSPLDPEHIQQIERVRKLTDKLLVATWAGYALGETKEPKSIGNSPMVPSVAEVPKGFRDFQKAYGSKSSRIPVPPEYEHVNDPGARLDLNIKARQEGHDAFWGRMKENKSGSFPHAAQKNLLADRLAQSKETHPHVRDISAMNDACESPIPKRDMDAFRQICIKEPKGGNCGAMYQRYYRKFTDSPRTDYDCVAVVNSLIMRRFREGQRSAFKALNEMNRRNR